MDVIHDLTEDYLLKPYIYPENFTLEEGTVGRQALTLSLIAVFGTYIIYFPAAAYLYYFVFDWRLKSHPLFMKNQVWWEIKWSLIGIFWFALLSVPILILIIRPGYSKLYEPHEGTWSFMLLSIVGYVMFTDFLSYFIHAYLHTRWAYKNIHKIHHQPKIPTPFASQAAHPMDSFLLSLPFHIYIFLFPMDKWVSIILFELAHYHAVFTHDGEFYLPDSLKEWINGPAHHNDHHLYPKANVGMYFTFWDKIMGTYRHPEAYVEGTTIFKLQNNNVEGKDKKM